MASHFRLDEIWFLQTKRFHISFNTYETFFYLTTEPISHSKRPRFSPIYFCLVTKAPSFHNFYRIIRKWCCPHKKRTQFFSQIDGIGSAHISSRDIVGYFALEPDFITRRCFYYDIAKVDLKRAHYISFGEWDHTYLNFLPLLALFAHFTQ